MPKSKYSSYPVEVTRLYKRAKCFTKYRPIWEVQLEYEHYTRWNTLGLLADTRRFIAKDFNEAKLKIENIICRMIEKRVIRGAKILSIISKLEYLTD